VNVDVAVCLPQEAETVALVRAAVTNTLTLFGVEERCVEDIRLALSEACTNVIEHATVHDEYEVRVVVDDDRCAISVKNTGNGFEAGGLEGVMPDARAARGRGMAIMRAVMDQVDFTSEPEAGTIVHLVKRLSVRDDGPMDRLRRGRQIAHSRRPARD
jgi:serine/threonine-protein kinase RsbW